ncbi:hypothetical protein Fmac_025243 [Flemingia macrophylla]|uniref:Uncharacterized protein n=1 Tax=Flemingia macrophylla TaxID=520843 RepID=A0ABD1LRP8_9FABA
MATAPAKVFLSLMVPCFPCRLRWSRRKVTLFMSGVGSLLAKFIAVGSKRFTLGETSNALSLGEGIIVGHMNSNIKEDESLVAWDWA